MAELMKVRIAVLVGSNGQYACDRADEADWDMMEEVISDYYDGEEPEMVQRYFVDVDIPRPTVEGRTYIGAATKADH